MNLMNLYYRYHVMGRKAHLLAAAVITRILPAEESSTRDIVSPKRVVNVERGLFAALLTAVLLVPVLSMAGTDTTFNSIVTMVSGWLTGSLGQTLALSGFGIALGSGLIRGSVMGVVSGLGLALASTYGPTVLTGLFTATI